MRVRHPYFSLLRAGALPAGCAARRCCPAAPAATPKHRRCPHGHDISCPTRHVDEGSPLGQPLCFGCYDYEAAVLFNAYAGDLWRRFTTYLPRQLARLGGVTQKELRSVLRIRYVKVAEYQARGVVHFHAVIRLDAPAQGLPAATTRPLHRPPCCATPSARPPPPSPSPPALGGGSGSASAHAVPYTRPIRHSADLPGTGQALSGQAVANYIAKYATKTLTVPGVPDTRSAPPSTSRGLRCSRPLPAK